MNEGFTSASCFTMLTAPYIQSFNFYSSPLWCISRPAKYKTK